VLVLGLADGTNRSFQVLFKSQTLTPVKQGQGANTAVPPQPAGNPKPAVNGQRGGSGDATPPPDGTLPPGGRGGAGGEGVAPNP
jgi:hypothetical protein